METGEGAWKEALKEAGSEDPAVCEHSGECGRFYHQVW